MPVLNLILYSRLTELAQVFPFPSTVDEQNESDIVSDPFLLEMPSTVEGSAIGIDSRVKFSDFVFREVGHSQRDQVDLPYNPDMTLIKLFWTDSSLAIHETIFRAGDKAVDEQDLEFENSNALHIKKRVVHALKKEAAGDDFVVDDWDESVIPSHASPHHVPSVSPATDLQWTLNWASIYSLVVANVKADAGQTSPEKQGFTLDQTIGILQSSTTEQLVDGRISETR